MRRCAVPRRALSSVAPSAPKPRVLLLAGPTGVGKSRLAVDLAKRLNGEIVSADSAAIYRGLDVGTAKPDVNMLSAVKHHLLDVANVNEAFSVMQWANAAHQVTEDILRRGKVPIVVGGSGLYFHWYLYGGSQSPPQKVHPEDSEEHVRMHYAAALTRLREVSPEYAESITYDVLDIAMRLTFPTVNVRRLSRALQKVRAGIPLKLLRNVKLEEREQVLPYDVRGVFLTQPRVELLPLLDYRCEKIVHAGLIEETANLILKRGMRPGTQPALAIGYRQVIEYFQEGNYTATTFRNFVTRYQSMTRNLVRKQETWFKKSPRYKWLFKPASETTLADVVARLYICPQQDYDAFPHTAPRELTPQESETLRQYSSQLCMWSFGASAKQARAVEALARRVHPILSSYVPPPHAYGHDPDEA